MEKETLYVATHKDGSVGLFSELPVREGKFWVDSKGEHRQINKTMGGILASHAAGRKLKWNDEPVSFQVRKRTPEDGVRSIAESLYKMPLKGDCSDPGDFEWRELKVKLQREAYVKGYMEALNRKS